MKFQKLISLTVCILAIILGLVGCGTAMDKEFTNATTDTYLSTEESSSDSSLPENRKLIQTVEMTVETENLDTVLSQINTRISELKGYIESSNVQHGSAYSDSRYRNATITVRIPAENLNSFINKVDDISNVVSSKKTVDDITLNYVATESRMKALQTEESRLLELMSKAETMDDLLTVEKRLTEVRTELEQVTSALKLYDNQVTYATVNLSIEEVKEYTEINDKENIWQRIGSGFVKSLKNVGNFFVELFVFLVVIIPYLLLIGAISLATVFIIKFINARQKRKLENKKAKEKEQ